MMDIKVGDIVMVNAPHAVGGQQMLGLIAKVTQISQGDKVGITFFKKMAAVPSPYLFPRGSLTIIKTLKEVILGENQNN